MLVDAARDHALNRRGKQAPEDVLLVRTLLQAGVRIDPALSEAYVWLYELAALEDDQAAATAALVQIVQHDPDNQQARELWMAARLQGLQTIEERATWLESLADAAEWPSQARAEACVRRAALELQQLDMAAARRWLDRAGELDPFNPDVPFLRVETLKPGDPPEDALRVMLAAFALNPLRADLAWQIGSLLDSQGVFDAAGEFYDYGLELHRAGGPGVPVPSDKLLDRSRNSLARGQAAEALQTARLAVDSDPTNLDARFFLYWLLKDQRRDAQAEQTREQLGRRFAEIRQPDEWPVHWVAGAAWYYATMEPQPQRALMLAENAAGRAPTDVFSQRVLGWAQAQNDRDDEARATLSRVADQDAFAAAKLAQLQLAAGDVDAPRRLVQGLRAVPRVGPAYELLRELDALGPTTRPAAERVPELLATLRSFDPALLQFYRDPTSFIEAKLVVEDRSLLPGQPWWAVFSLHNKSPHPITLGPDRMVNPVFLLSFKLDGEVTREYPHLMTISLDRARVITPGETIRVRRTVDVGPVRFASALIPQHLLSVTIDAILDAQQVGGDQWAPSQTGQTLPAVHFNRLPASTSNEYFYATFAALTGPSDESRFAAIETLALLLGESQRAQLGRLRYKPDEIPREQIHAALLSGLRHSSWEVRARTLHTLEFVGLDAAFLQAAEACLDHPHWLVRLEALRLLARQGDSFAARAQQLADHDDDELVRDLAESYLRSWNRWTSPPAATAPASTRPARTRPVATQPAASRPASEPDR